MPVLNLRGIYFPYCLQRLDDGSWIILNRNYKPLGSTSKEHVVYEDIDDAFRIPRITPGQVQKLSCTGSIDDDGRIYLYEDSCIPTSGQKHMTAYLERLAILMRLKLTIEKL